jgi:prepilin-type N-terminal cleavage/methylation domain-containing protein
MKRQNVKASRRPDGCAGRCVAAPDAFMFRGFEVSPSRAFTLIETIAAIVILAVALPPLLWAVRESHVQRVTPVQISTARWLAAEQLEDIIADRHSSTRGYSFVVPGNYPAEPSVAGFPAFGRSVAITETGPDLLTAGQGFKLVTVQVTWADARSAARILALSTVVTNHE